MHKERPIFNPIGDQTFELIGKGRYDFKQCADNIEQLANKGAYNEACEARYAAFILLAEAMPEDEPMMLSWEHANSRAAMGIIYGSALDHFRIGDLEMAMAQLEMLLDCDPEDHFEATNLLALCYIAMEEWDSYDDITIDLSDKSAEAVVARLWASQRRGSIDTKLLSLLKSRYKEFYAELTREEHPDNEAFRKDIASERPSQAAIAREWWLITEPLWAEYHDFVEALR